MIALQFNLSIGTLVDYAQGKKDDLDTELFRWDKIIRDKSSGGGIRIQTFVSYVMLLDSACNDYVWLFWALVVGSVSANIKLDH